MDFEDFADIGTAAAAFFAFVMMFVAIVSTVIASRAKNQAEESAKQAKRSANAAEISAEAARRSAQADETMARLAEERANQYRTPWRFELKNKSRYRLIHDNDTETAYEVSVEGDGVLDVDQRDTLGPQETLTFLYSPSMQQNYDVTVKWRRASDPEGKLRSWTGQP